MSMKIALASPAFSSTIDEGLSQLKNWIKAAAMQQAEIICFPESYIPGYPTKEFPTEISTPGNMQYALGNACNIAMENSVAIILPMDWFIDNKKLNVAFVISRDGEVMGYQTKNQLDPSEDEIWVAGTERKIFEINNVKFGITICHEGFRYPESVRWAARNGASIVFHPHFAGSNSGGVILNEWGNKNNPYYEKAMMMRALENTIYFASVNYATKFQESATSLINPGGNCVTHQNYGEEGIIVAKIDPPAATGLLAKRFKAGLYSPE